MDCKCIPFVLQSIDLSVDHAIVRGVSLCCCIIGFITANFNNVTGKMVIDIPPFI